MEQEAAGLARALAAASASPPAAYQPALPLPSGCVYTSCYCEENVWKLCEYIQRQNQYPLEEFYAVFISNDRRMVPLWKQQAGCGEQPVIWNFTMSLTYRITTLFCFMWQVEIRTLFMILTLCFLSPAPLTLILKRLLNQTALLVLDIEVFGLFRKVRLVQADVYLKTFASDRSHMKDASGNWLKPPPLYPCIETADFKMNLDDFISMNPDVGWGSVFSLPDFVQTFGSQRTDFRSQVVNS
ncbi:hypothetical protein JD844_015710 [Phrynosoma platyrhinos]|uniref:Protein N-terminal glutamine amidohydrolase n=1 Tax=Phrynosoma platyrhinos TaxID=52577 RepID=A0ABQ7SJH3_PHRPL|nr:hypothetical protein JD844_015710 [Phrynosoma platyrhinos]